MPNHVQNKLVIINGKDGDDYRQIKKAIINPEKVVDTYEQVDFNLICPEPANAHTDKDYDWYGWRHDNWGCKWNAYETFDLGEEITFQTPWGRPEEWMQKLSKKFPKTKFLLQWADEDWGSNCGAEVYLAGSVVSEISPAEIFSMSMWDYELSEEITDCLKEYGYA